MNEWDDCSGRGSQKHWISNSIDVPFRTLCLFKSANLVSVTTMDRNKWFYCQLSDLHAKLTKINIGIQISKLSHNMGVSKSLVAFSSASIFLGSSSGPTSRIPQSIWEILFAENTVRTGVGYWQATESGNRILDNISSGPRIIIIFTLERPSNGSWFGLRYFKCQRLELMLLNLRDLKSRHELVK